MKTASGLETKFQSFDVESGVDGSTKIYGYASVFDRPDQGGDVVQKGAYGACLQRMKAEGRSIKMLWQHDPSKPIGIWDEIIEDERGLYVKGHFLTDIQAGAEASILVAAGAIDGLSIGYRTKKAKKMPQGGRILSELDLWEISLVTFPMLPEARVKPSDEGRLANELVAVISQARENMLT